MRPAIRSASSEESVPMTKRTWIVALVIGALVLLAFGARAMAQGGDEVGGRRTITVTSSATVGSEPDQATLDIGVQTQADESADALADNAATTDDVLGALRDAGVAADDVQTRRLDVYRRTIDRKTPRERRVYVADASLSITVRDLDSVGAVIERPSERARPPCATSGSRSQIPPSARTQALEQAVEGARTKADAMAAAGGASVTGVERMIEEGATRPVYEEAAYRAADTAGAALAVVPPDELDPNVTVTVTWAIGWADRFSLSSPRSGRDRRPGRAQAPRGDLPRRGTCRRLYSLRSIMRTTRSASARSMPCSTMSSMPRLSST